MTRSEAKAVAQARAGYPKAWDTLFQRYQMPLFVYVSEMVGDEQTSLDIVQEAFIRATKSIDQLRDDAKFGSWLFGIAQQRCIDHWRKRKREPDFDDDNQPVEVDADVESPSEWLVRKEEGDRIIGLIKQLPPRHRAVLLLYYVQEFSLEEIAEILDCQMGTLKSRLYHARQRLRRKIERASL